MFQSHSELKLAFWQELGMETKNFEDSGEIVTKGSQWKNTKEI